MLSDSMEIFIPLYFKKNGLSAVTYGSLQSVTNDTAYGRYMDHGETEDEK